MNSRIVLTGLAATAVAGIALAVGAGTSAAVAEPAAMAGAFGTAVHQDAPAPGEQSRIDCLDEGLSGGGLGGDALISGAGTPSGSTISGADVSGGSTISDSSAGGTGGLIGGPAIGAGDTSAGFQGVDFGGTDAYGTYGG